VKLSSLFLAVAACCTLNAQASIISLSNNSHVAICDTCTVTSTIDFSGHGRVLDVNALIDITHSYDADLVISLSHGGSTVLLSNRQGGSGGADYTSTVFDDQARDAISAGWVYAPFTGAFKPEYALAAFNDADAFGLWTLTVTDSEAGDFGTINRFGIAATVPEPGSLALFGLGMLVLGAARKRRK
jgi:subtilisin-like proprotein convertase family protein